GFLSMQRQDFSAAIHWLQLAEQHGARDAGIRRAMSASQFWLRLNAASAAFANNKMQDAEAEVQAALRIDPENPNAVLESAKVMVATGRPAKAIRLYRQVLVKTPESVEAWSGWLTASIPLHRTAAVIQAEQQLPPAIGLQLLNDPGFLSSLAQAYVATGQQDRAEELLAHALQLSPPAITTEQRQQIALQYAALCVEDRHYDQASQTYRSVLSGDPGNLPSWQGIVLTQHLLGQDRAALDTVKQMPAGVHAALMQNVSFVTLLAGIDQSLGKFNAAEGLLLQAQSELQKKGQSPSIQLLQQMASLDLQMHQPKAAVPLYRQALAHQSQGPDPLTLHGWIGLLSALHQAGEDRQAIEAQKAMPPAAYRQMLQNPASFASELETYFSTMAGAEQSLGNLQAALRWLEQLDAVDRTRRTTPPTEPPIDMELQEVWLQYNLNRNRAAQDSLQRLRNHLRALGHASPDQAKQMADLTANLAVRRATQLTAQGDRQQALQVLNTASQQVEGASAARTRLAAGYLTAGEPATAVAIYQSVDMRAATVGDLRAAVGAAMETKQTGLAQEWLQLALNRHPDDPGLLLLAGEFAQSNDNLPLAEQYLRTSLLAAKKTSSANPSQQIAEQQQATERLDEIEASYSGWLGGTGYLSHFSGTPGITQLTDVEVPVEASTPIGDRARVTAVVRTVYLNSGSYTGVAGQPLGTPTTKGTYLRAPAVPMTGVGGSLQVATRNLAASLGLTPSGLPVMNLTAAAMFHVPHNPWTLSFSRDSIRESQLSYAGLHDPANTSNVWGGVVANSGAVQYARGNSQSGWYATASGGVVTGRHVAANPQFSADAGQYRQVWARTGVSLRAGVNFYAQHNSRNELLFTYGHGGYFSPEYYLLPAVPLTLSGASARRFHYEFSGSMGPQIFRQASARYFPLDPTLQAAHKNQIYPAQSTVSLNYGATGKAAYLVGEHFRFEGFFSLNNASNYNQQIVGISLHYLFRRQRFSRSHPAGWFPYSGLRPYLVP
ncbi:MAG: cellulose synthase subunit BcsC-related outer membrane protein, partial [Acidobacteriaceae bacterium]